MASEAVGTCKLCGQVAPLQRSHIIPRAFYKRAKAGSPQLVEFTMFPGSKPVLINADPKERLLCHGCEQHFSIAYERWGTRLFYPARNQKKLIVDMGIQVKFKDFRYEDTYLFFLSILWRAGVSTLEAFNRVTLSEGMERLIAGCLKDRTLLLAGGPLRVDNFIKLGLIKLTSPADPPFQEMLRRAIFGFGLELFKEGDGFMYYFGVGGFLVVFYVSTNPMDPLDGAIIRSAPRPGTRTFRADCVPFHELSQIVNLLNSASDAGQPTRRRV
ncbi:MAG: hypothetical protein WA929_09260 [Pseudomonas neustonica]